MSHLDDFNVSSGSNCFGVDLEGCFRTASFGGDALTIENTNDKVLGHEFGQP